MFTNLEHNIILLLVPVDPRPLLLLMVVVTVSWWQEVVRQLVGELVTITLHLETMIRVKGFQIPDVCI